jgi:hypothetical protein
MAGRQPALGNQTLLRMRSNSGRVPPAAPRRPSQGLLLQRKCACGANSSSTGECAECAEKRETMVQRQTTSQAGTGGVPPVVHDVLRSSGEPLAAETRAFMEPRFGQDFNQVRIHTDEKAEESARVLNALAYTVGDEVVVGAGQYAPSTNQGKRLLAHELAHVVQQRGGEVRHTLEVGSADGPLERQADAAAETVLRGETLPTAQAAPLAIQRQDGADEYDTPPDQESEADWVHDGWATPPVEAPDAIGELSDTQAAEADAEAAVVEEDETPVQVEDQVPAVVGPELGVIEMDTQSKAKKGGGKPPAGKKPKPKKPPPPVITDIHINLSTQKMTVTWSDGRPPEVMTVSTGTGCPNTADNPCKTGDEPYCTPKLSGVHPGFKGDEHTDNDQMAWYVELVKSRSIGIHNSQDANGTPLSHGCIRTGQDREPAKRINKNVTSNTTVTIEGDAPTKPFKLTEEEMKKKHYSRDKCPGPA